MKTASPQAVQPKLPLHGAAALHTRACAPTLAPAVEALELFHEGDALYDAMLSAIRSATRSIRLESYIFADDAVGAFLQSTQRLDRFLRRQGVKLRWFRWRWRNSLRYNRCVPLINCKPLWRATLMKHTRFHAPISDGTTSCARG